MFSAGGLVFYLDNFYIIPIGLPDRIMRHRTFILILFIVFPSILSAEVFKGTPTRVQGSNMTIRWETSDETPASAFVVVRREFRSGGMGPWEEVGRLVASRASSVYTMEDAGVFKSADRILEYEVRAVNTEGRVVESVRLTTILSTSLTSAARRTWGSIKAMFR
ncbi:MAG: hypothetical protein WEB37_12910 [Bacteroidota bacterium]